MRIFCPATLLLPSLLLKPGTRAYVHVSVPPARQSARPIVGRSSVAPDTAPLFTCRGPPAPAVGRVTLTQPRSRPKLVAFQGWDRTRPFGRWSYARPGANLAQGNLNSMPHNVVSAKFLAISATARGGRYAPHPALSLGLPATPHQSRSPRQPGKPLTTVCLRRPGGRHTSRIESPTAVDGPGLGLTAVVWPPLRP